MDDLYHRVARVADDPAALARLADRLTPKEVRALVAGLDRWKDLREACTALLRRRMTPRLVPLLWRAWQRHPLLEPLQQVLRVGGDEFGWDRAVAKAYTNLAPSWVTAPHSIVSWLAEEALSLSDLGKLSGRPIDPDSPLAKLLRETLMTSGSPGQLQAEAEHFPDWYRELQPELKIRFGQHYLQALPPDHWAEHFLNEFGEAYGTPRRPHLPRFWNPIPPRIKEQFQRRYVENRIEEELGHDDERSRFWRRWADHMVDVHRGRAGGVRYAALDFDVFTVFEFFELGNAAYFYLPEDAERMRARTPKAPWALKEQHYYWSPNKDNRLIHNSSSRWYAKGDYMVNQWLASAEESE